MAVWAIRPQAKHTAWDTLSNSAYVGGTTFIPHASISSSLSLSIAQRRTYDGDALERALCLRFPQQAAGICALGG